MLRRVLGTHSRPGHQPRRRRSLWTFAVFFLLLPHLCLAELVTVPVREIAATQVGAGHTAISEMMEHWGKTAQSYPGGIYTYLQEKVVAAPFPSTEGPSLWGEKTMRTYILDGHHRASGVSRILYDDYDKLPEIIRQLMTREEQLRFRADPRLHFRLDVTQRHKTLQSLVEYFVRSEKGFLPAPIRNQPEVARAMAQVRAGQPADISVLVRAYAHMARHLPDLKNVQLRTSVAAALFKVGIDSSAFIDYIEFYLGERVESRLAARGLQVTQSTELSDSLLAGIQEEIFGDPETLAFLKASARPGKEKEAQAIIAAAKEKFAQTHPELAPAQELSLPRGPARAKNCSALYQQALVASTP